MVRLIKLHWTHLPFGVILIQLLAVQSLAIRQGWPVLLILFYFWFYVFRRSSTLAARRCGKGSWPVMWPDQVLAPLLSVGENNGNILHDHVLEWQCIGVEAWFGQWFWIALCNVNELNEIALVCYMLDRDFRFIRVTRLWGLIHWLELTHAKVSKPRH